MKHIIKVLGIFSLLLIFVVSCVDNPIQSFEVEKPASITEMEYLNEYDALKTYVNANANPGFKLGAGVTVSEYVKEGLNYRLINSNFDQVTAGNAMKYASVVNDEGNMDFSAIAAFVEAARSAGTSIYGHTLLWHAQQNKKYLLSLIADKEIEIDPDDANNALHIKTPQANDNIWDWQLYYNLDDPMEIGKEYTFTMRIKASEATTVAFWRHDGAETSYGPDISVGESWSDVDIKLTPTFAANILQFNFGTFGGDLYFDDISLTLTDSEENLVKNGDFDDDVLSNWEKPSWHGYTYLVEAAAAGPAVWWTNLVSNSDAESDDVSSYFATEKTVGPGPARFSPAGTGVGGEGRAIMVESGDNPGEAWDTQFFIRVPKVFEEGESYRVSMMIKADKPATSETQAHKQPGEYLHYELIGNPNFTTEWKEYTYSGTIKGSQAGMSSIAFNLSVFDEANTYYFDDIYWEIEESGSKIPQTPEEKADTLTWALENWIAGVMEATDGYVTSWDVVNEALSGADLDGDGIYDLESATNVSAEAATNNFYWQDYLGDLEFTRTAVALARKHGPADLKLFVNDYNLESDWDDNKKLKSLIEWIDRWESDGVTVIDGIGTQMHVSCYMNPDTQASKERHVVKMFELMAATGKLVQVTELDMGLVDADGNKVLTKDVTEAQHMAMSEYYKFIVEKYFEIIPTSQQHGITHWAPTDSPEESSWRGGEPIGLWTLNNNRKHTYSGFADGLAGK